MVVSRVEGLAVVSLEETITHMIHGRWPSHDNGTRPQLFTSPFTVNLIARDGTATSRAARANVTPFMAGIIAPLPESERNGGGRGRVMLGEGMGMNINGLRPSTLMANSDEEKVCSIETWELSTCESSSAAHDSQHWFGIPLVSMPGGLTGALHESKTAGVVIKVGLASVPGRSKCLSGTMSLERERKQGRRLHAFHPCDCHVDIRRCLACPRGTDLGRCITASPCIHLERLVDSVQRMVNFWSIFSPT